MPQGPDSDSYRIYLSVNIIDDTNGVTFYNITNPVIVTPNLNTVSDFTSLISSNDPNSQILLELNSGNLNLVSKNVIALALAFNLQTINSSNSTSSNQSIAATTEQNNQLAVLREFLASKIDSLVVLSASNIKNIASTLAVLTNNPNQITTNSAVFFFYLFL